MSQHVLPISVVTGLPEIGRYYLVPCVLFAHGAQWRRTPVPIIGERHHDPELGVRHPHFHFDWRFISDRLCKQVWGGDEVSVVPGANLARISKPEDVQLVTVRRRCVRQMPDFPGVHPHTGAPSFIARTLEPKYQHVRLRDCRTCPHRGMPLNGLPVNGGVVVCPGHGLAWDLNSGRMVPRMPEVAHV